MTIRMVYTLPTLEDSPIRGEDVAEVVLNGGVMNMGVSGGRRLTVDRTTLELDFAV